MIQIVHARLPRAFVGLGMLAALAGCRHDAARQVATNDVAAECTIDGVRADTSHARATANPDSLRKVIDSLDRRVAAATTAELPVLLLERGRVKSAFQPGPDTPAAAYAKAHPKDFHRNGGEGEWLYDGTDFSELIQRFPNSELADDAGYALVRLAPDQRGECEDFSCDVARFWPPLSYFLNAFPSSPLADSAAYRALRLFASYDSLADPRAGGQSYEPAEFLMFVKALDTTGRVQRQPVRARLLTRVGELWDRDADYARARSAYQAALVGADTAATRCINAHLAAIPAHTFTLAPARAISTHRVELRWDRTGAGQGGFRILRSSARGTPGAEIGRAGADAQSWTDTTVRPGGSYWYHLVAVGPSGDTLRSNLSAASAPTPTFDVLSVAVSTTDHALYLFGSLFNAFPQVLKVSPDGSTIERSDGMRVGGSEFGIRAHAFDPYVDDLWLAGAQGRGVLHFRKQGGQLPAELFAHFRHGGDLVRTEFSREAGRAVDDPVNGMDELLVSVDDASGAVWVDHEGGGGSPIAMDCVAAESICWVEYETHLVLRNDSGVTLASAEMPRGQSGREVRVLNAIYADSRDSSAWVVLCAGEHIGDARCTDEPVRLVQIDRHGAVRHDVKLAEHAQASSVVFAADRDRGVIWFRRTVPGSGWELGQIDMHAADPQPRPVMKGFVGAILADFAGGVWAIHQDTVRRLDGTGRILFTTSIAGK